MIIQFANNDSCFLFSALFIWLPALHCPLGMWEWVLGEMVSLYRSPNLLMQRVREQIPQC